MSLAPNSMPEGTRLTSKSRAFRNVTSIVSPTSARMMGPASRLLTQRVDNVSHVVSLHRVLSSVHVWRPTKDAQVFLVRRPAHWSLHSIHCQLRSQQATCSGAIGTSEIQETHLKGVICVGNVQSLPVRRANSLQCDQTYHLAQAVIPSTVMTPPVY